MADEEEGVDVTEESPLLPSPVAVDCAGSIRTGKDTAAGGGRGERGERVDDETLSYAVDQARRGERSGSSNGATRPPTRRFFSPVGCRAHALHSTVPVFLFRALESAARVSCAMMEPLRVSRTQTQELRRAQAAKARTRVSRLVSAANSVLSGRPRHERSGTPLGKATDKGGVQKGRRLCRANCGARPTNIATLSRTTMRKSSAPARGTDERARKRPGRIVDLRAPFQVSCVLRLSMPRTQRAMACLHTTSDDGSRTSRSNAPVSMVKSS